MLSEGPSRGEQSRLNAGLSLLCLRDDLQVVSWVTTWTVTLGPTPRNGDRDTGSFPARPPGRTRAPWGQVPRPCLPLPSALTLALSSPVPCTLPLTPGLPPRLAGGKREADDRSQAYSCDSLRPREGGSVHGRERADSRPWGQMSGTRSLDQREHFRASGRPPVSPMTPLPLPRPGLPSISGPFLSGRKHEHACLCF